MSPVPDKPAPPTAPASEPHHWFRLPLHHEPDGSRGSDEPPPAPRARRHHSRAMLAELLPAHDGPCLIAAVGHDVHTSRVLRTSVDLAGRLGARLHVVHVIDEADFPVDPDSPRWEEQAEEELHRREQNVHDELATSGLSWSYHALHGHPGAVLRDLGDLHQPLLLVVGAGARGLGGALERLTFGSPSSSLLHHSSRPVLVVPPAAGEHGSRRVP